MPNFELLAVQDGLPAPIDAFDASDADEAIILSVIRLERREMELRRDGKLVARFSRDGRLTRSGSPPA